MKKLFSLLAAASWLVASAQTTQQTAGIYTAYPEPESAHAFKAPKGYEPVYISHYGRHGSRWITTDERYTAITEIFDSLHAADKLTPLGQDVRLRLHRVCADALGRSGHLTPLGERQHFGIGARMAKAYPLIFADSAAIKAQSSTAIRCIMSMEAFLDGLRSAAPAICPTRSAYDKDMQFIAYTSPQGKAFTADTAAWRSDYWAFAKSINKPARLCQSLIADSLSPRLQAKVFTDLYWIASDMQNVDIAEDFYDIFTYDELYNMWRTINSRMYVCNGPAPLGGGIMPMCASNLLSRIIADADSALASGATAANLRFGHDTHLLRLLAFIGIDGATTPETDFGKFHLAWQDYRLSPMAANLQLVFFKNDKGDVLAGLLLNEHPASIPALEQAVPGLYSWPSLKKYFSEKLL